MGKALNVFIVLNLLLGAGVVAIGTISFSERKLLKAEALELESTMTTLSEKLQWGAEVPWENSDVKKAVPFTFSQPLQAEGLSNLRNQLDPLSRFATQRQSQLSQRNGELVQTKSTLAETRDTLATRERELAAAKNQEANLKIDLKETNEELESVKKLVSNLESTNEKIKSDINRKNNNLSELNNELASLEIDLETRIQERNNVQAEYDRCRGVMAGDQEQIGDARGEKGLVLAVNQDWEYVIIDKGDSLVGPDSQAFVHRGKEFVAKLNIIRVEEGLAVAEIVPNSVTEGLKVLPGDTLFF